MKGRAMAQAVSRRPLTSEARVRSRVSPCGICGGQSGTGTGFSPSTSVFPCQFHFTGAPLHGKTKKKIIFFTGLHNRPQGCVASVASAAGPFTTKKKCRWFNGQVRGFFIVIYSSGESWSGGQVMRKRRECLPFTPSSPSQELQVNHPELSKVAIATV